MGRERKFQVGEICRIQYFLRMRRGTDESAIESMAEASDPVIIHK